MVTRQAVRVGTNRRALQVPTEECRRAAVKLRTNRMPHFACNSRFTMRVLFEASGSEGTLGDLNARLRYKLHGSLQKLASSLCRVLGVFGGL